MAETKLPTPGVVRRRSVLKAAAAAGGAIGGLGSAGAALAQAAGALSPTQKLQPESDAKLAKLPPGGAGPKFYRAIMRKGDPPDHPKTRAPSPPPVHSVIREDGLVIEKNVAIPLRDGVKIYADLFKPDGPAGQGKLPVIIGWSPYGKHGTGTSFANSGVKPEWINKHTAFEAPNPEYWCPHGYAVMFVDPRGLWWSEGEGHHNGIIENLDCYDTIEWAGVQPWCNGKVGLSGVSYLAAMSWAVAPLKPPHLAAINPWEGFSDWYREFAFHGGIRETGFAPYAVSTLNNSLTYTEDTTANILAHPLNDAYYESKKNYLEDIECPMFVVASWSDQGLHTRGTLEGFKAAKSKNKWLEVHGQKKWGYYYDPANVEKLRQFFDCYLKGTDKSWLKRPKVRMEVRDHAYVGAWRDEAEWPLKRQQLKTLYLDAKDGGLKPAKASAPAEVRYDPKDRKGQAVFDHTFDKDTEISGHMKLKLWVEAVGADDMDMFVAIQKLGPDKQVVPFVFYATFDNGPVALGWLRASHRALNPVRSRPEQPYHDHAKEERLQPGVPVPLEIEIWPSSTLFKAGESLRVVIKGRDIYDEAPPTASFARHNETRNQGTHVIRTGGRYDSHLLYPVIPRKA